MNRAPAVKPLVDRISDTALWIAAYRALETERRDALFHDRLAGTLAGEKGRHIAMNMPDWRQICWATAIRTRAIDQLIVSGLKAFPVDCVLNLASGLDTRPYRLPLPAGLDWVEVDLPEIVQYMDAQLREETPRCRLSRLALDLTDPARREELFRLLDGFRNIMIVTEGFLSYLSEEQVDSLIRDMNQRPNFRYWIQDYHAGRVTEGVRERWKPYLSEDIAFQFSPPDWIGFFCERGWEVRDNRMTMEESRRFGRRLPGRMISLRLKDLLRSRGSKSAPISRTAGYVLLENERRGAVLRGDVPLSEASSSS